MNRILTAEAFHLKYRPCFNETDACKAVADFYYNAFGAAVLFDDIFCRPQNNIFYKSISGQIDRLDFLMQAMVK